MILCRAWCVPSSFHISPVSSYQYYVHCYHLQSHWSQQNYSFILYIWSWFLCIFSYVLYTYSNSMLVSFTFHLNHNNQLHKQLCWCHCQILQLRSSSLLQVHRHPHRCLILCCCNRLLFTIMLDLVFVPTTLERLLPKHTWLEILKCRQ